MKTDQSCRSGITVRDLQSYAGGLVLVRSTCVALYNQPAKAECYQLYESGALCTSNLIASLEDLSKNLREV